jgi:hypothetical protein
MHLLYPTQPRLTYFRFVLSANINPGVVISTLFVLLLTSGTMASYACSCVHNPKWTLTDKVNSVDMVVKGKIISVADYSDSLFPWHYKLFRLVIEKTYKTPFTTPDTISIITGQDGSSCGYAFKLGKEYIVYGRIHRQTNARISLQPDNAASEPGGANTHTLFETDICTSTKESNKRELTGLKRLTK